MSRILILGANHASTMNSLKIGFDEAGIKSKALSFDFSRSVYNNYERIKCLYPNDIDKRGRIYRAISWRYFYFFGMILYIKELILSDTVIYYSYPTYNLLRKERYTRSRELWLIKFFVKKRFVWYTGSDIRDPNIELAINPFFKFAWEDKNYEYKNWESSKNSKNTQLIFSRYGFNAIVWDQYPFIDKDFFDTYSVVPHASLSSTGIMNANNRKKIIIHAPTAPVAKGSQFIIAAIEKLKQRRNDFEFLLLQNMSNQEYQSTLKTADILIDQLIWGAYGVAAQQALQSGKIVVAYLLEDRLKNIYGKGCPIINANIDNIETVLEQLLDLDDMTELKNRSFEYYTKMHSPLQVASKVMSIINNIKQKNQE